MTTNTKATTGTLVYKQFIVLDDGTEVQVRYNQNPDLYKGTDVKLYKYTATEGKGDDRKDVTRYAVAVADAKRAKKATAKEVAKNLVAELTEQGLSAEEILARLVA